MMESGRRHHKPLLTESPANHDNYNSLIDDGHSLAKTENRNLQREPKKMRGNRCFVCLLTTFAAMGGFMFGYDMGVISGAMIGISKDFGLAHFTQSIVVSMTIGTAALFSLPAGWLSRRFGRKPPMVLSGLVFTIGALVMAVAPDVATMVVGRAIFGIGIGITTMTGPLYIAEVSPAQYRGILVGIANVFITGGQFLAALSDGLFAEIKHDNSWRYMLGMAGFPSFVQLIGLLFLPESPRWLLEHGREDRARLLFERIHGTEEAQREIEVINKINEEKDQVQGCTEIFTTQPVRRALIVGSSLLLIQQLCGISTVAYYSATIIKMSGVQGASTQIWLAAAIAASSFVFSIVGLFLVERMGRRWLSILSLMGVTASLAVLAIAFRLSAQHSPPLENNTIIKIDATQACFAPSISTCDDCLEHTDCGFCFSPGDHSALNGSCVPYIKNNGSTWDHCTSSLSSNQHFVTDFCPTQYSWLALVGLVIYLMFYAVGISSIPWIMNSEIYPQWARSTCFSIATSVNWVFAVIVAFTFLSLTDFLGKEGTFWLYTAFSGLGVIFIAAFVPETKGLTLEEVQKLFTL